MHGNQCHTCREGAHLDKLVTEPSCQGHFRQVFIAQAGDCVQFLNPVQERVSFVCCRQNGFQQSVVLGKRQSTLLARDGAADREEAAVYV